MAGICILTETFYPVTGGGETQALALSTGLARRGYPVCVITRRNEKTLPGTALHEGVSIYRVGPSGRGQLRKWALLLTALGALLRHRRRYEYIVVSGFRILGIPAMLVAMFLGKKTFLKADNMGEMSGEYFRDGLAKLGLRPASAPVRLFLGLRNALLKKCTAFIAISSPIRRELEVNGVPVEAIVEIPNGVDTDRFRPVEAMEKAEIRRTLGIPEDAFVVIYTGRLVDYKGLPLLLRVWQASHAGYGNARLLLVGAGGMDIHNCERELRDFARDHGLAHSVAFTGSVDNVQTFLQASDVFILPTEREAFGSSLIEAMACGLPVIATDVGGIPDILGDESLGCLIPANDFQQLRDCLERLYHDDQTRLYLGRNARQSVLQRYSEQAVQERYVELVESPHGRKASGTGS